MADFAPLADGETILWEGKPDTKLRFGMETMATGIFAVAMILACLGLATVIDRTNPGTFWPVLGPGLVVGLVIVLALPVIDSMKRRRTRYRLTSHHADIAGPRQTRIPLPPLDDLIYRDGNPPSIYFTRHTTAKDIGFERIAEAREVFPMIRARATELHP